jgi:hypothetical protein
MGTVTSARDCGHWKGLLAMDAIGRINGGDRVELHTHVEGCDRCQADRNELFEVVSALALADGPALDDSVLLTPAPLPEVRPSTLDAAVLAMLSGPARTSESTRQKGRRHRVRAGMAVAAAVIVVIGTFGILHHEAAGSRTVALQGPGGSYGTALLVPETWGTSIELTDHGERGGQVLTVSMRTEYGRLWLAGSYRSVVAGEVRVTLSCALRMRQIASISITDSSGHEVMHS